MSFNFMLSFTVENFWEQQLRITEHGDTRCLGHKEPLFAAPITYLSNKSSSLELISATDIIAPQLESSRLYIIPQASSTY